VTAGKTTAVTIRLKGSDKTGNGSVTVNGTLNVGPVVDELTLTPLKVYVGSTITLNGLGSDADNAPSPVSYYWSSTGGVITDPIKQNATLTSPTPGTFTVKLTVSDGELSDSASTTVTFVEREEDGGGSGGAGGEGGSGGEGSKRPNILLIIADDYGAEAASIYPQVSGETGQAPVPNIEALAQNGLVFDNAWASPVCSPTRGTIVSGLYGYRTGVTTVGNVLPTSTVTLFDRITADSPVKYDQAFFGKYHLGGGSIDPRPGGSFPQVPTILQHIRDLGITTYRGILGGGVADYFNWTTYDINGPNLANTTYATTALTDYAIDFIHQHETTKPDEPWFLYQAYNGPHAANGGNSPYQVPPPELHQTDLSSVGSPKPGTYATNVPVYKANIQALDTEVGRLLKEVDLDDTVVIFAGDNGVPDPVKDKNGGLRAAKGSAYEGGVRVPLVVAGAGVTRRGREDELFVTTDIYATVLSLAGVPVSHVNNSYSITPVLSDDGATSGRTHSFTEASSGTNNRTYAIKDKRFKLLATSARQWELYDLVADPLEKTNLYANTAYAAVRASLEAEIAALKVDAPAPGYFP
jgi:arylsulfatase A-like enzyme